MDYGKHNDRRQRGNRAYDYCIGKHWGGPFWRYHSNGCWSSGSLFVLPAYRNHRHRQRQPGNRNPKIHRRNVCKKLGDYQLGWLVCDL
jgi:hypothetical protein